MNKIEYKKGPLSMDDESAAYEALGHDLINLLGLVKRRKTGRYDTSLGSKSTEGLGRTIARIVHEHISIISERR